MNFVPQFGIKFTGLTKKFSKKLCSYVKAICAMSAKTAYMLLCLAFSLTQDIP